MNQFKEFGIKNDTKNLIGDKVKIDRILNVEISIIGFRIELSKYEGKGNCLYLQISIGDTKRVLFTSSKSLMNMIEQVPAEKFPFMTKIIKQDERLEFS